MTSSPGIGLSKPSRHMALIRAIAESSETPYAKTARVTLLSNETTKFQLPDFDAYSHYRPAAKDYALYTYLRKFRGTSAEENVLAAKAILSFEETEAQVALQNYRLDDPTSLTGALHDFSVAARKIRKILGRFNPEEWLSGCEWGPGATSSLKAESAALDNKVLEPQISVTPRAFPFMKSYLVYDTAMFAARCGVMPEGPYSVLDNNFSIVHASRLTTVEKSITERRVIDIQPTANLFLQKGIGKMIRRRLGIYGIDLDDQSRNQWLASVAQRLQLCTIDLAKASDTVSTSLVRMLLPDDWYCALRNTRTDFTSYNGKMAYLHKFSAMGNGYTFELESLIFYALLLAAQERHGAETLDVIGVYGDDLIVPKRLSKTAIHLLEVSGFTVNSEKSFLRGRFFESCGKHYFDGYDITPPYQKEGIVDFLSACRAANRIFRWALRLGRGDLDGDIKPIWLLASSFCSEEWEDWQSKRRLAHIRKGKSKNSFKVFRFPHIPWYSDEDSGLLWIGHFPHRNGFIRYNRVICDPVDRPGDEFAIYATSLRRGVVVERPSYGLVTIRGRLKRPRICAARASIDLVRFPDWF